jgi:tetratricopeptide (TPR) repeat protein
VPADSDQFDFFVSYSRADNAKGWITRFIEELLVEHRKFTGHDPAHELKPFFDKQDIRSLDDWQQRIHDSLAKSRLFLAFISPNYFASEWCRREWKDWVDTEIAKHILSAGAAPIYFVEVPGFVGKVPGLAEQATFSEQQVAAKIAELCGLPKPHDGFAASVAPVVRQMRNRRQITSDFVKPLRDEGIEALRRADLHAVLERLAQDLDRRAQDVKRAADSETTVPPYNKKFSGRLDELLALRDRLKDDRAGVISGVHGLGGIGKTELAFTYAHAFASAYPGGRFLVPCEGKTSLRDATLALGGIKDFHSQISDEERKKSADYFAAVIRRLHDRLARLGHILLVLDNVTDAALLTAQQTDCLTALGPKLHLLATTRLAPPVGARGNWLTLGELPEADALDLLEKHRPFVSDAERDASRRIVKRLGGFALAVELVAAWLACHEQSSSYTQLAAGLGLEDLEQIAGHEDVQLRRHNHERRLTAVLGPMLEGLKPAERRALEYAALLPPDCVPLPWLRTLVTHDFPELARVGKHTEYWTELCERLIGLALLTRTQGRITESQVVRVHRLVQEFVLENDVTKLTLHGQLLFKFVKDRLELQQKGWGEPEAQWEVRSIAEYASHEIERSREGILGIAWKVAIQLWCLGEGPFAHQLVSAARKLERSDNHDLIDTIATQALLENEIGNSGVARSLFSDAIARTARLRRVPLHRLADSYGILGIVALQLGRLRVAFWLTTRCMLMEESLLPQEHPFLANTYHNLADIYFELGKYAEAKTLVQKAIAINRKDFSTRHLQLAFRYVLLARIQRELGELEEAKRTLLKAFAIERLADCSTEINHANIQANLACVEIELGNVADAAKLLQQVLEVKQRIYGPVHPQLASTLSNIGNLKWRQGDFEQAERFLTEALGIAERSDQSGSLHLATICFNLALVKTELAATAEAERLMSRAYELRVREFGHNSPLTEAARQRLSSLRDLRRDN